MDSINCSFCKKGKEEENVCGSLHMESIGNKTLAAHHKCMQYSALLTQYKFDHFGGFKIDRVQAELQRGRCLKCAVCKIQKKKNASGATCGCAYKACRKTFHYYCAKKDSSAVTKRYEVNLKNSGTRRVLYRVFCSEDHEKTYRESLKKGLNETPDLASGDDSDISDDDDDDETDVEDANPDSSTQASQSEPVRIIPTPEKTPVLAKVRKTAKTTPVMRMTLDTESYEGDTEIDEDLVQRDNKRQKMDTSEEPQPCLETVNGTSTVTRLDTQRSSATDDTEDFNTSNEVGMEPDGDIELDTSFSGRLSQSEHANNNNTEENVFATSALVITSDLTASLALKQKILKEAKDAHNIQPEHVFLWHEAVDLRWMKNIHLPLVMNEMSSLLKKKELRSLKKYIVDRDSLQQRVNNMSYSLEILQKMEGYEETLYSDTKKNLADAAKYLEPPGPVGRLVKLGSRQVLFLELDDRIDHNQIIRKKLSVNRPGSLFIWDDDARLQDSKDMTKYEEKQKKEEECSKIRGMFKEKLNNCKVVRWPEDTNYEVICAKEDSSVTAKLANVLKSSVCSNQGGDQVALNRILCICNVDRQVLNYKHFCRKAIRHFLHCHFAGPNCTVYCVFDISTSDGFVKLDDLIPDRLELGQDAHLAVHTALKPAESPSCAVLVVSHTENHIGSKSNDSKIVGNKHGKLSLKKKAKDDVNNEAPLSKKENTENSQPSSTSSRKQGHNRKAQLPSQLSASPDEAEYSTPQTPAMATHSTQPYPNPDKTEYFTPPAYAKITRSKSPIGPASTGSHKSPRTSTPVLTRSLAEPGSGRDPQTPKSVRYVVDGEKPGCSGWRPSQRKSPRLSGPQIHPSKKRKV